MKRNGKHIAKYVSEEDKRAEKIFWKYTFALYALAELVYLVINYTTTRSFCKPCVLAFPFYILNWFQQIIYTGLLWFCLNRIYHLIIWKAIFLNIILFAAHFFLWILALYFILNSGWNWLVGESISHKAFSNLVYEGWIDIGKYVLKLSAFYVLKFYFEYRRSERKRIQLAVINKNMQLNLLKQQLSPHFYFNTLNNLYGLARSNNKILPDALDQLSNIMQYVIVDCNQTKVLLSQEIKFLESYMALEKLRYEQNTVIEMKVEGKANGQTILPLVLIQFVENAFKHGMKEKSDKNWMKVHLVINNSELVFHVENSFYESETMEGIGISTIKRILNLKYEGKHEMRMLHEANHYSVTLKLNLL